MAVFSTNQNRQLYVVKAVQTTNKVSALGDIKVSSDKEGNIFFNYKGVGNKMRTDIIDPKTITDITLTTSEKGKRKFKQATVTLDTNVNGGSLIVGEDYILRINFRQLYGMSDSDIYQKYGAVHVTKAMQADPSLFWAEMAYSLVKNFKNVYSPLLDIKINDKIISRATKINGDVKLYEEGSTTPITLTGATSLVIVEASQVGEYVRGVKSIEPVYFEVLPTTVYSDGEDVVWGKVANTVIDANIPNGYDYADLEYFCMGERGDQYRNIGWPNSIHTEYLVDVSKNYNAIDIHYAYQGTCEDIQKSEKHLTIISTADLSEFLNSIKALIPGKASKNGQPAVSGEGGRNTL